VVFEGLLSLVSDNLCGGRCLDDVQRRRPAISFCLVRSHQGAPRFSAPQPSRAVTALIAS